MTMSHVYLSPFLTFIDVKYSSQWSFSNFPRHLSQCMFPLHFPSILNVAFATFFHRMEQRQDLGKVAVEGKILLEQPQREAQKPGQLPVAPRKEQV